MSDVTDLQTSLRDIRAKKAAAERDFNDARARLATINAQIARAGRGRPDPSLVQKQKAAQAAVSRLSQAKDTVVAAEADALGRLTALGDPTKLIENLDDSFPIALFPLRLETRFMQSAGKQELWVRIYPDDCQVQAYTDFIAESELAHTRDFWINYWKAGGVPDQQRAAWRGLVAAHGSGRATLLVGRYRPAGTAPTKAHAQDVLLVVDPQVALAATELTPATNYWTAFWRAGKDAHARDLARQALVGAVGAAGADKITTGWRPANLDDQPLAPFTRTNIAVAVVTIDLPPAASVATTPRPWQHAPSVKTLPEWFVVTGIVNDDVVFSKQGAHIPASLAVGPDPSLPDDQQIKSADGELTLNKELRWLTDFDEAIAVGMGVKVPLTPQQFARGFDKLIVLGVRISSNALHGAELLEALLQDHQASKSGFALLPQGTPTNNTEETTSGYSWTDDPDASFDRVFGTAKDFALSNDLLAKRDGQWLAEMLGIDVGVVRQVAHADGLDQAHARAMNTALWPTTWGYFLETMIAQLDDDTIEDLRTFFIRYVSGRGGVPAIRIGKQPYGILPATVHSRLYLDPATIPPSVPITHNIPVPGPGTARSRNVSRFDPKLVIANQWPFDFVDGLQSAITTIFDDFKGMLKDVPHVGQPGDSQQTLLDIIGLHPSSVEFHQRFIMTMQQMVNQVTLDQGALAGLLAALFFGAEKLVRETVISALGLDPDKTPMLEKILQDEPNIMKGPVIDDVPLSETSPIRDYSADGKNYLEWLASSGFDTIRKGDFGGKPQPSALFYLMARCALQMAYWDASVRLLATVNAVDLKAVRQEPGFLQIGDQADGTSKWANLVATNARVTGDPKITVGEFLDRAQARVTPAGIRLQAIKKAFATLQNASTASLERLFAEHIDLCTYRLDAWRLGLVNHRLAQQRQRQARGIYLGAYGWLEQVRPENKQLTPLSPPQGIHKSFTRAGRSPIVRDSTNGGYIHAPTINHATTAAILRNAYLSHATKTDPGAMSVNLSSARVRAAMAIVEGMQRGQGLAELLGYQFERGLHDAHNLSGTEVEAFTLPLRTKFPLVANKHKLTRVGTDVSISKVDARNVLDGLKLAQHVRTTGKMQYPFGFTTGTGPDDLPAVSGPTQQKAIDDEVALLLDTNDAVGDLMLSESVHQVVQGQPERAAAAADVIGKGVRPPEPEVVRTPGSGMGLVNRVVLHLDPAAAPAGSTPRAVAEPAIDAWLASRLPAPDAVACAVHWSDPTHPGQDLVVTQALLGLAPADLLHLVYLDGQQGVSELDDRIEQHVRTQVAHHPATVVTIRYTAPVPGKVTFFELAALMRSMRAVILQSRELAATDMARAGDVGSGGAGWNAGELRGRVSAAVTALSNRVAALQALAADSAMAAEEYLEQAAALFLGAALHGVPQTGTGSLRGRVRELYRSVTGKLNAVIARWVSRQTEYDALIAQLGGAADDVARIALLARAEDLVSTAATDPRPTVVAQYQAIVAGKRAAFNAALGQLRAPLVAPVTRLRDFFTQVEQAIGAIPTFDPVWFDVDRKANDLAPERAGLATLRTDIAGRAGVIRTDIQGRVAAANKLVTAAQANADVEGAVKQLGQAAQKVLGDAAKLLPRVVLDPDPGAEMRNAFQASDTLLTDLIAGGRDFPVDDWLYGAARVRSKLAHWENAAMLTEGFGRPPADLVPVQLPFLANDRWAALELPANYDLNGEKLLYTASFARPFDDTLAQCGLVIDEWTEVVPAETGVTGITFHFDQPNTEPPQTILLATPPHFSGAWHWDNLIDTIQETMNEAKLRAIEPDQVAGSLYGQFLPATLLVVTKSLMTISTNLADNNK